jgi:hypothetical protein
VKNRKGDFLANDGTNNAAESANESVKKTLHAATPRGQKSPAGIDDACCKLYYNHKGLINAFNLSLDGKRSRFGTFNPEYVDVAMELREKVQQDNYSETPMSEDEFWEAVKKLCRLVAFTLCSNVSTCVLGVCYGAISSMILRTCHVTIISGRWLLCGVHVTMQYRCFVWPFTLFATTM